jgi:hypothetical protein
MAFDACVNAAVSVLGNFTNAFASAFSSSGSRGVVRANAPPVDAAGRGEDGGDGAAEDGRGASGEVTALGDDGRECVALGGNSERALSIARWSFRIVMPNRKIEDNAR